MLSTLKPAQGRLLISEPFLEDPEFMRSVILIADETDSSTLGVILNQKSLLLLSDVLPHIEGLIEFPVFIGGPVERDAIFYIHRCYDKIREGFEIAKGIYWSYNFDIIEGLIERNEISNDEIKFFVGYSGWGQGQLEDELVRNSWIVSDKYHPDVVFSALEEEIWREVIINLGPKYAHIINFPQNPNLN